MLGKRCNDNFKSTLQDLNAKEILQQELEKGRAHKPRCSVEKNIPATRNNKGQGPQREFLLVMTSILIRIKESIFPIL